MCASDDDYRYSDALFFIAWALQTKVDEVLNWHTEIVSAKQPGHMTQLAMAGAPE
jgi:hypothetical protein